MNTNQNEYFLRAIRKGIISNKVNQGAQAKHDVPNDRYSYLEGVTLQEIIDAKGGTGELVTNPGGSMYQYVNWENAGQYVGKNTGERFLSNQVKIVYNQTGAHGWPSKGGTIIS